MKEHRFRKRKKAQPFYRLARHQERLNRFSVSPERFWNGAFRWAFRPFRGLA
jgi:hypothetical protein